jgi:hypothetical protein
MTRRITLSEYHEELRAQGVHGIEDVAVVCPACRTPQSLRSFLRAGVERTQAQRLLGFTCVGSAIFAPCRFAISAAPQPNVLVVDMPDGSVRRTFPPASRQQAQDLAEAGGLLKAWLT